LALSLELVLIFLSKWACQVRKRRRKESLALAQQSRAHESSACGNFGPNITNFQHEFLLFKHSPKGAPLQPMSTPKRAGQGASESLEKVMKMRKMMMKIMQIEPPKWPQSFED